MESIFNLSYFLQAGSKAGQRLIPITSTLGPPTSAIAQGIANGIAGINGLPVREYQSQVGARIQFSMSLSQLFVPHMACGNRLCHSA
jgi:hypothetical protein